MRFVGYKQTDEARHLEEWVCTLLFVTQTQLISHVCQLRDAIRGGQFLMSLETGSWLLQFNAARCTTAPSRTQLERRAKSIGTSADPKRVEPSVALCF
jgi:hypothetical protein